MSELPVFLGIAAMVGVIFGSRWLISIFVNGAIGSVNKKLDERVQQKEEDEVIEVVAEEKKVDFADIFKIEDD